MRRPAALLLFAVLAGGCASVDLSDLPPEPIAFVHRTLDQGRRRAELVDDEVRAEAEARDASVVRAQKILDYLSGASSEQRLADTFGRLALLDPRTLEIRPVPGATAMARPLEWSRDHRRLLFAMTWERKPQVFEYDTEGEAQRRLTPGYDPQAYGSLAPDGRLAFSRVTGSGRDARARIWVTDPGGGGARPLTDGPFDYRPSWSPDGRVLLFSTELAGRAPAIARADPDGGGPPRIVVRGRDPVFTPDGAWVVFSAEHQGHWRLWRMRPDGTAKGMLGGGALQSFDETYPAVSPDGRFVVYVALESGRERLRIRRFDGGGDRPLLEAADGASPVW
jgi:dipeptidyl aminopeptidase/acylaminoacyl peptidase